MFCPCAFEGFELGLWSVAWYEAHKAHHLATFPDVDEGTVRVLDEGIERARVRETS